MKKRTGFISVDCDTVRDYLNVYHLDSSQRENGREDIVYQRGIPRFLEIFDRLGIKGTFFIVGKDFKNKNHLRVIKRIIREGHEIGNHTLSHLSNLEDLPMDEKRREVEETDRLSQDLVGVKMVGYRGPGYAMDDQIAAVLEENGYWYDCSMIPSFFFR